MEPDGNDARRAIHPNVGQPGWNSRLEQFQCDRVVEKGQISRKHAHFGSSAAILEKTLLALAPSGKDLWDNPLPAIGQGATSRTTRTCCPVDDPCAGRTQ